VRSLSGVSFSSEPAPARRAWGPFSSLFEIDFACRNKIPHYYLGYYVGGCGAMSYKGNFRPHELLGPDGTWRAPVNSRVRGS